MSTSTKNSPLAAAIVLIAVSIPLHLISPCPAFARQSGETNLIPILSPDYDQPEILLPEVQPLSKVDATAGNPVPRWDAMFTDLPRDWYRGMSLAPRVESIRSLATLGVFTYSLVRVDNEMWRQTRKFFRSSEMGREFANYSVALGDGRVHLGIAGAFAGYGWLTGDARALRTASQTVEVFLATGVAVQVLKHVTGRESPAAATHHTGRWKFFPHIKQYHKNPTSYYAFPSGHISTTMGTLTVIAENYPEQRWIKPVGYTLVGAVGIGLVAKGMHWYSDLPVGIALGYLFGKIVSNPEMPDAAKGAANGEGVKVSLAPGFDGQGGSRVSLAVVF